jgi:hypothetical protein
MSAAEAETFATSQMGDLKALAGTLRETLPNSSWMGRHRVISFGVLPLFSIIIWWLAMLVLGGFLSGVLGFSQETLALPSANWPFLQVWFQLITYAGSLALPLFWCWMVRRKFCGFKWALPGCALIAIHNMFHSVVFEAPAIPGTGQFIWHYRLDSNLAEWNFAASLGPFLVLGLFLWGNSRAVKSQPASCDPSRL